MKNTQQQIMATQHVIVSLCPTEKTVEKTRVPIISLPEADQERALIVEGRGHMLEKQVSYSYCILEGFMTDDMLAQLLTSASVQ